MVTIDTRCKEQLDLASKIIYIFNSTSPGSQEQKRILILFNYLLSM